MSVLYFLLYLSSSQQSLGLAYSSTVKIEGMCSSKSHLTFKGLHDVIFQKTGPSLYFLLTFSRSKSAGVVMDTVCLYVPTKQIKNLSVLKCVMFQDLVIHQGASQLQTASENLSAF
jgi:hypothetical protein